VGSSWDTCVRRRIHSAALTHHWHRSGADMITKLTAVACIAAAALVTADAASPTRSEQTTRFAGFPPVGAKASTPTRGKLEIGLRIGLKSATTEWNVYADGRVIWQKWSSAGDATVVPKGARTLDTGYVQQRLMLPGLRLLRWKILATGLFEHNLLLDLGTAPCCT